MAMTEAEERRVMRLSFLIASDDPTFAARIDELVADECRRAGVALGGGESCIGTPEQVGWVR